MGEQYWGIALQNIGNNNKKMTDRLGRFSFIGFDV
jgi:hypothetical protein